MSPLGIERRTSLPCRGEIEYVTLYPTSCFNIKLQRSGNFETNLRYFKLKCEEITPVVLHVVNFETYLTLQPMFSVSNTILRNFDDDKQRVWTNIWKFYVLLLFQRLSYTPLITTSTYLNPLVYETVPGPALLTFWGTKS